MRICVGDIEADGLLPDATQIWCGVFKDIKTGVVKKFWPDLGHDWQQEMKDYLDTVDVLIMHNGIQYDKPLLKKVWDYDYKGKLVDTLWMSRLQNPKRMLPPNAPDKRIGPHSVEAWGLRFGRLKPNHEDWSQFSGDMLHRCSEDVEIQHLTYNALMEEGKPYNWINAHKLTFKLFEILQKQEEYGWLVDQPYMHKCIHMLTHWMDRIDRVMAPHLPLDRKSVV